MLNFLFAIYEILIVYYIQKSPKLSFRNRQRKFIGIFFFLENNEDVTVFPKIESKFRRNVLRSLEARRSQAVLH